MQLEEFLKEECEELAIDCDDIEDARQYIEEIIADACDLFPERASEIEALTQKTLKEVFEP
jgi:predicted KAP-like P-loop ATPase